MLYALSLRIRDDPRLAAQGLVGRESFSPKSSVELSTETVKLSAETVKLSGGNGKISSRSGDSVDQGGRKFPAHLGKFQEAWLGSFVSLVEIRGSEHKQYSRYEE